MRKVGDSFFVVKVEQYVVTREATADSHERTGCEVIFQQQVEKVDIPQMARILNFVPPVPPGGWTMYKEHVP